jgi:hypothetical protein
MNVSDLGELSWKTDVFGVLGEFRSEFRSFRAFRRRSESLQHLVGFTCELSQLRVTPFSVTGYVVVAPLSQYADLVDRFVELRGGASGDLGCPMTTSSKSKSYSRRSIGAVLLVGVLAGVTVGGGVGVFAASSTKSVTVCANKKTNVLRYAKNGKCVSKTETKVTLNQTGVAGARGDTGTAGAKGDTGAAGTNGTNGTNATVAITQLSICGVGGTSLCKIGMTGPGGGLIFFVDYNDQYVGLNYLEAAPVGWGNGAIVNEGGLTGETTGSSTVDPSMKWCSNTSSLLGLNEWSNSGVGAGASNTSTADTTCTGGAIQAASDYAGGSKSDWFLPSVGEAMLMYTNLRQAGVGGFASAYYWSSSEDDAFNALRQYFYYGNQEDDLKTRTYSVRPVRAF